MTDMNADKTLKGCQSIPVVLEKGKPLRLHCNRAVPFEIVLVDGSIIKGINPAGENLEITSNGAVSTVNVINDEIPMGSMGIN